MSKELSVSIWRNAHFHCSPLNLMGTELELKLIPTFIFRRVLSDKGHDSSTNLVEVFQMKWLGLMFWHSISLFLTCVTWWLHKRQDMIGSFYYYCFRRIIFLLKACLEANMLVAKFNFWQCEILEKDFWIQFSRHLLRQTQDLFNIYFIFFSFTSVTWKYLET